VWGSVDLNSNCSAEALDIVAKRSEKKEERISAFEFSNFGQGGTYENSKDSVGRWHEIPNSLLRFGVYLDNEKQATNADLKSKFFAGNLNPKSTP
jgi:hypothetical protein